SSEVYDIMIDSIAVCVSEDTLAQRMRAGTRTLRNLVMSAALSVGLAACGTTDTTDTIRINKAQGAEENIASLTSVIKANPSDPEGYNTRGSAYGRAGQFGDAL